MVPPLELMNEKSALARAAKDARLALRQRYSLVAPMSTTTV
jgi:hypothetical protein